ncbi:hypothetical protein AAHA92_17284 [Salvia divinorum]|uniref:Reverse transcriptase n=1 Tax=Salvia divinorum TaxID=28513 RepID=A0ABD1GYU5_SALDI
MERGIQGEVHANLIRAETEVTEAQANFEEDPTPENRAEKRTRRLHIHSDREGTRLLTEDADIRSSAVSFFQKLLAPEDLTLKELDLSLIHQIPPSTNMDELTRAPDQEEVKRAAFDISKDSAPGPDGLSATFYQTCWAIVGADVTEAVGLVFNGAFLPRSITAMSIILLTKKEAPEA